MKALSKEMLVRLLEEAMLGVAREKLGADRHFEAEFNDDLDEVDVFEFREVVDIASTPGQIALADARVIDAGAEIGDELGEKVDTMGFGLDAARLAKQRILELQAEDGKG